MRRTRWLLLVAIAAILGGVGATYQIRRRLLERQAPPKPAQLPLNLAASSQDWEWTKTEGGRPVVHIRAREVQQASGSGHVELKGVELRIFHKDGSSYDLVKSAAARFVQADRRLVSDGDVEITLAVPVEGERSRPPVVIRSKGVDFDTTTGKASTAQPTQFTFENGTGRSVGASYDSSLSELTLASQVELNWKSPKSTSAMKLETGELIYREGSDVVVLQPWSRLTRGQSVVNGSTAFVTLKEGEIDRVETKQAAGEDRTPERQLQYAADQLYVHFAPGNHVQKIEGHGNARAISRGKASVTTITSDRVDLSFVESKGDHVLSEAFAHGNSVVEAKPLPAPARQPPPTRILRSQVVQLKMREGGREIAEVATHSPGTLDFLPNRPADRQRRLSAQRFYITYGSANQIQSFRAAEDVHTESQPSAVERKRNAPVTRTRSKNLTAEFNAAGEMTRMEQWDAFEYEEGARRARAARATLDAAQNLITLSEAARVWDAEGATSGDIIRLNQANGDVAAEGRVTSSRAPEKKPGAGLLTGSEPLQAMAKAMTTSNRNRLIRYEGDVVMWQGMNRLTAQKVVIDREKRRLEAEGQVVTHLREQEKPAAKKPAPPAVIKAPRLVYSEETRLAHYTGGATLLRGPLVVKSAELRAFLSESDKDSTIERALADGAVEIVETSPGRARKGTGEHAEYYVADEKVILRGGNPELVDSRRGNTRGAELTYWANDDRLLVTGEPGKPVSSRIRRQ
jgi:lipopolysaccharide export system protein LptA